MVRFRQRWRLFPGRTALAAMVLLAAAPGCKSWSWASRPSWMGGGTPPASALSAAPSFDKDVPKPSETAKPYPTTNTPDGYVLSESTTTAGGSAPAAAAPPAVVTYGSSPPPSPPPSATAAVPPVTGPAPASAGIGPQVGPYAPLQPPADPAAAVTAGLAAAPGFGEAAPPAATVPPAGERMADARTSGWVATPPTPPAPTTSAPTGPISAAPDSRYGATGSRFSSGGFPAPPAGPPAAVADPGPPSPPAASTAPPEFPSPEATPAVPAAGPALPGSLPPPTRRPDPGYRPGGTSSYRSATSLLVGEGETPAVQPAGFTAP